MANHVGQKSRVAQHEGPQIGRAAGHGFEKFPMVLQHRLMAGRQVIPEPRRAFAVTGRRQMLLQSVGKNPSHGAILALALVKRKHQLGAEAGLIVFEHKRPAMQLHDTGHKAQAQAIAGFAAA